MNLDHVFIGIHTQTDRVLDRVNVEFAAVRTDRRGNVLAAYRETVPESSRLAKADGHDESFSELQAQIFSSDYPSPFRLVREAPHLGVDAFLKRVSRGMIGDEPTFRWDAIYLSQVAWPLVMSDIVPDANLDTLSRHFGLPVPGKSAEEEVTRMVQVYWYLMQRYRTVLGAEETIRQLGGESLQSVRRIFGF